MAPLPLSAPTRPLGTSSTAAQAISPIHPNPTATADPTSTEPPPKKRKKRNTHTLHTTTFRKLAWTYFRLRLTTTSPHSSSTSSPQDLDPLTIRTLLTPPLQSYLGLMGTAIPMDILKSEGRDVWLRVPRQDARGLQASLSGWVGSCDGELVPGISADEQGKRVRVSWRVVSRGGGIGLISSDGRDLFNG